MEAPSPRTTVIVGGKGTSLPDPHSVYDVSHGAALVQIDTPALDRLFQFARTPTPALLPPPESPAFDKNQLMSRIEARATLFVLLNKLLQGQARIRPFIPIFVGKILNHFIHLDLPLSEGNAGVSVAIVDSIYKFKKAFACTHELDSSFDVSKPALELFKSRLLESNAGEPGVTKDELETLDAAVAPGPAIAALSIHLSSSICMASDVIAALSCEALQLNTQAFEAETSGESVSYKAENDVASDLRTLLFGSKLVNLKSRGIDPDFISSIPSTHGCLREDLKLAASRARIEINSASVSKRKPSTAVPDSVSASPLAKSLLCVLLDMESVVSHSLGRLAQVLQAIRDADATSVGFEKDESGLLKFEEASQTHLESLKKLLSTMVSKLPDKDYLGVTFSSEAYTAMRRARKILASEAVAALALLHVCDCLLTGKKAIGAAAKEDKSCDQGSDNSLQNGSIENSQSLKDGKGIQVHDKKKKKGGREMILGRGTSFVRQSFMSVIEQKFPTNNLLSYFSGLQVVEEFLDPKNTEFQSFLDGVKVILECNEARRLPQVPKGTRDFTPEQMAIREKAFGIIASVFKRHGAVAIDTPVFELRETLMGKYGEDSKLIFDLADQGGQICSLRYDLTVPFARYLAMNSVSNLKRYHIARVYRRDNPSKGRYREFYQCDFDIAGNYASMVPDFEVIEVLTEMLDELDIGDYQIKLNHRGLLDGMLDICGVPKGKFRAICSAIDKLDKVPWELVRKEMIEEKGLTEQAADKIGEFVKFSGAPPEVLQTLKAQGSPFLEHIESSHALEDLATLFRYLKAADCLHRVVFDLSLARGLDYYTGVIYEAAFVGSNQVGSIAAGGRYDNLVGMFSGKQVPAVGVSLGIERVFTIMEQKVNDQKQMIRATQTEVLVVVLGEDMEVAIKLVKELWTGRIRAEFVCVSPRKFQKQLEYALDKGIPWMIVVGNDELEKGVVRLQDLASKQRNDIPRSDIVGELQRRGFRKELDFHPVFQ